MNDFNRWVPVEEGRPPVGHLLAGEAAEGEHPVGGLVLQALHVVWKWKWVVAPVVVLALIGGLTASLLTTPMYRATTEIRIDREATKVTPSVTDDKATASTAAVGAEFYQTQYGILRTDSIAFRAVDDLKLDQNPAFLDPKSAKAGHPLSPARNAAERESRRRWAASNIRAGLDIVPVNLSGLVNITYSSPDPAMAVEVADGIATAYIEYNQQRGVDQSKYARDYVSAELDKARIKLDAAQQQAVDYARANKIIDVKYSNDVTSGSNNGGQSLASANLTSMNTAMANASSARIVAENHWNQVKDIPAQNIPEVQSDASLLSLRDNLSTAQVNLQNRLVDFGDRDNQVVQLRGAIAQLKAEITAQENAVKESIHTAATIAAAQETSLAAEVGRQQKSYLDLSEKTIAYNIILRDVDTDSVTYNALLNRLQDLSVAANITVNNVSIIDHAQKPSSPFKPTPVRNLIVSALVGLVLGALLAQGIEQLDETIKAPVDIETKLNIPLLGAIPVAPKDVSPAQAMADPRSALSEAYYSVRTALQFSTRDGAPRTLLVTSARPSEGKSTTAIALGQGFARLGVRTLLIDSDLRNPSLHKQMAAQNSVGLSNLLTGQVQLMEAVQSTAFDNLSFIACGPLPPNPAELLGGSQMRQLLAAAAEHFDQVILDGPPVMGLADAPLLASFAAGTILVVEAGSTRRSLARSALARLRVGPVNVVGAVLSKFSANRVGYGYGYGYGSSYGAGYGYSYDYGGSGDSGGKKGKKGKALAGLLKGKKG